MKIDVKISGDIAQLMRWYFVTLEPPYWYLRCHACDCRHHLPWDERIRTQEAHETLVRHGRRCVDKQPISPPPIATQKSPPIFQLLHLNPSAGRDGDLFKRAEEQSKMDMSGYAGSSFIRVEDLADGPQRKRLVSIEPGRFDKPVAKFDDGSQLSLNATNVKTLLKAYGPNSDDWIDMEVELYAGTTKYNGEDHASVLVRPISPPPAVKRTPQPRPSLDDEIPF